MLHELTADQESLRDTTARFLAATVPAGRLRELHDDDAGFDRRWWERGAELGWTSLLVPEAAGGGSVSGRPVVDATLLAHEFGFHAAPGPLLSCNLVAAALGAAGPAHAGILQGLLSGSLVGSWCLTEAHPDGHRPEGVTTSVAVDGGELVVDGTKRPVEAAAQAEWLLVTGRTGAGLTQVLVPAGAPGVRLEPMTSVDLTRRFGLARFDGVRVPAEMAVGEVGDAARQIEHQLQLGLVLLAAESVGAMQQAFETTLQWSFDRYTFGRPLASYQELKHRFADMKTWLETGHAMADVAASAVECHDPDAAELASAAAAFIGHYGAELLQDCVQMHGGIGLTYEHDLHLFLRRVTLNRTVLGTPSHHRRRIAALLAEDGGT